SGLRQPLEAQHAPPLLAGRGPAARRSRPAHVEPGREKGREDRSSRPCFRWAFAEPQSSLRSLIALRSVILQESRDVVRRGPAVVVAVAAAFAAITPRAAIAIASAALTVAVAARAAVAVAARTSVTARL